MYKENQLKYVRQKLTKYDIMNLNRNESVCMEVWMLFVGILFLGFINQYIALKTRSQFGENEFTIKMASNSKDISSCIIGIILIIIAINFIELIKWPLIIYYAFLFFTNFIVTFLITLIFQISLIVKKEYLEIESWYVIFSNFILSICYLFMAYSIYYFLFL